MLLNEVQWAKVARLQALIHRSLQASTAVKAKGRIPDPLYSSHRLAKRTKALKDTTVKARRIHQPRRVQEQVLIVAAEGAAPLGQRYPAGRQAPTDHQARVNRPWRIPKVDQSAGLDRPTRLRVRVQQECYP
jgi:hypothetical protein